MPLNSQGHDYHLSAYTSQVRLAVSDSEAIKDLFFNGQLSVGSCTRQEYGKWLQPSTICNHIRILYYHFWGFPYIYQKSLAYLIQDSKAAVIYLKKAKNDPYFDRDWWKVTKILNVYDAVDKTDNFWDSSSFKSTDVSNQDINRAKRYIQSAESTSKYPYSIYHFLYIQVIAETFQITFQKDYVANIILTCIHMRNRIDRRIISHERASGNSAL